MTEYAFVAHKPCGCPTFARLCGSRGTGDLKRLTEGMTVRRVPVDQANLVVCRCD
jgi:hypothetical protein